VNDAADGSSYSSRAPMVAIVKGLAQGKFNRTLATMVNQCSSQKLELNLALNNNLCRGIYRVATQYKQDFIDKEEKKDDSFKVVHTPTLMGLGVGTSPDSVEVIVSDEVQDEDEYKKRLLVWTEAVTRHEDHRMDAYIGGRIVPLVDALDEPAATVKKLEKVPVMSERKRNMWLMNDLLTKPMDWNKVKKARHSMQHPMNAPVDEDKLDTVIEVYSRLKTTGDDSLSDDILGVISCGPLPHQFTQPNAQKVYQKFRAMTPKHQSPKICGIETSPADIISRIQRVKSGFVAKQPDQFIFTKQRKGGFMRKQMTHLPGGDTYFNRFPVQAVAFSP